MSGYQDARFGVFGIRSVCGAPFAEGEAGCVWAKKATDQHSVEGK